MKINSLFGTKKPLVSFEFFPPKTDEGYHNLMTTIAQLKSLGPSYVSITYGAGGSTRQKTIELVKKIKSDTGIEAAAHLTCVGHSQNELKGILEELKSAGVENIIALRGDPPKGQTTFVPAADGFSYASQLVGLIKSEFSFCVGVAGYPEKHIEAPSLEKDLVHLKEKVSAGADFVITQLFFNNADYFSYIDRVRKLGVKNPVIAGIMPITDSTQIKRFAQMCGAKIPSELLAELDEADGNPERIAMIGIDHAVRQCEDLLKKGAPGIHFYTLNKSYSTKEIFSRLKEKGLVN